MTRITTIRPAGTRVRFFELTGTVVGHGSFITTSGGVALVTLVDFATPARSGYYVEGMEVYISVIPVAPELLTDAVPEAPELITDTDTLPLTLEPIGD